MGGLHAGRVERRACGGRREICAWDARQRSYVGGRERRRRTDGQADEPIEYSCMACRAASSRRSSPSRAVESSCGADARR